MVVLPERKAWHPVVWQQQTLVPRENPMAEYPHKRIIRNIRRLLKETESDPIARQKHIEHMFLSLPTASKDEEEDY